MSKLKVISFKKEKGTITVGELEEYLKDFDKTLEIYYIHEAGIAPLIGGKLVKYDEDLDDYEDEFDDYEDDDSYYNEVEKQEPDYNALMLY